MTDARRQRVIDILERTREFLRRQGEDFWVKAVEDTLRDLQTDDVAARDSIYRQIRHDFLRGMGSLQDLTFLRYGSAETISVRKAKETLNRLTDELHEVLAPDF